MQQIADAVVEIQGALDDPDTPLHFYIRGFVDVHYADRVPTTLSIPGGRASLSPGLAKPHTLYWRELLARGPVQCSAEGFTFSCVQLPPMRDDAPEGPALVLGMCKRGSAWRLVSVTVARWTEYDDTIRCPSVDDEP